MFFDYDVIMTLGNPHDTHHGVVINRAKLDAYTSSSLEEFRQTDTQTDRILLYILDLPALPASPAGPHQ